MPPTNIFPIDTPATFANYAGIALLETGGSIENMVVTADFKYWKQGMRQPIAPPTGTLGGTGWTASLVARFTWYDSLTAEHSELSAESATFAAVNQTLTVTNSNMVPTNPRVTHIGVWLEVDGNLPRLAALREIGVGANITLPGSVDELGEAWTEDFQIFPRCKYNAIWHDRQIMAGDDQNPSTIYISLIGLPERKALFELKTKTGQPVTGLFVVNDQLIVTTQFASERISGYTEDDLAIEIAYPEAGCISNGGVEVIHGYAWVPTHLGWYETDGASWYHMALDIDSVYVREFAANQQRYERMWSVHDPVTRVYVAGVGTHADLPDKDVRWVADYKPSIPAAGGGLGQPNWMYDTSTRDYHCGAALALPRGRRKDVFFGGPDGFIYKQSDEAGSDDFSDGWLKTMHYIGPGEYMEDCGGDPAHGKELTEINFYLRSELCDWQGLIHAGDAEPYPCAEPWQASVPASQLELTGDHTYLMQPQWTHWFPLHQVVGQGFQVELLIPSATPDTRFSGYEIAWKPGVYSRLPQSIQDEE